MTFHLKETVQADLPARATPITDVPEKRRIMERICSKQGALDQLEKRVSGAPLMRVTSNRFSGIRPPHVPSHSGGIGSRRIASSWS